jgi:hypothetical protein
LGKGSYGKVYKVLRCSDEKLYALKETDLGQMTQQDRMDAVNEVRLLVSIDHPSVVRLSWTLLRIRERLELWGSRSWSEAVHMAGLPGLPQLEREGGDGTHTHTHARAQTHAHTHTHTHTCC